MNRPFPKNGSIDNGLCMVCGKVVFGENVCECLERTELGDWRVVGRKDDGAKVQWHLLPTEEVEDVVRVLMFGCKKYSPWNWQKVENGEERYRNAASRHIARINLGESNDPETNHSHYAHALCSLIFAFWHSRNKRKEG